MAAEEEQEQIKNRPVAIDASFSTPGRSMVVRLGSRGGQGQLRIEVVNQPKHGRVEVKDRQGKVTDRHGAEGRRADGSRDTNSHNLWKVSGNGGGRWYFWGMDKSGPNEHADYRHLLIDGTSHPPWLYGCNLEKAGDWRDVRFGTRETCAYLA